MSPIHHYQQELGSLECRLVTPQSKQCLVRLEDYASVGLYISNIQSLLRVSKPRTCLPEPQTSHTDGPLSVFCLKTVGPYLTRSHFVGVNPPF